MIYLIAFHGITDSENQKNPVFVNSVVNSTKLQKGSQTGIFLKLANPKMMYNVFQQLKEWFIS